jgi:hypothetical protein
MIMKATKGDLAVVTMALVGLACSGTGLGTQGPAGGAPPGTGGVAGGASGAGGAGTGGTPAAGGRGGATALGGASGAGGATCATTLACPPVVCLHGEIPNPCGCPTCAEPDAGSARDASADVPCPPLPCPMVACGAGSVMVTPACGCPTCVPADAGATDLEACPPVNCPAIRCAYGIAPNPDPCACPQCALPDAAADTSGPSPDGAKLACVDLDECTCQAQSGCGAVTESCYCPFPKCGSGACICGGGRFLGCVPSGLATCASARDRVAGLCPQLAGTSFDKLCDQADTRCTVKCLAEVGSCADIFCGFCTTCDCMADPYSACVANCTASLTQK